MIRPIKRRTEFEALRRHGRRARSRFVAVTVLDDPDGDATGLAFAIAVPGRARAVTRNRARRRLRAAARELDRRGELPRGLVLVRGGPELATVEFDQVSRALRTALDRAVAS